MFETIKIYQSKVKLCLLLIFPLVMYLFSIYLFQMAWEEEYEGYIEDMVMSGLCILFFGGLALLIIALFGKNTPVIEINEHGIIDGKPFGSVGLIVWRDIESVGKGQITINIFSKIRFIEVHVPFHLYRAKYLARKSEMAKRFDANRITLTLTLTDSPYTAEQLCVEIQKRLNYFQAAAK